MVVVERCIGGPRNVARAGAEAKANLQTASVGIARLTSPDESDMLIPPAVQSGSRMQVAEDPDGRGAARGQ